MSFTVGRTSGYFVVLNLESPVMVEDQNPLSQGISGRLREGGHSLAVRVYFEDTDFSGLVYHTSYLRWCERGRSDYLRLLGIRHNELAQGAFSGEPCAFAVRRISAEYLKPARIDDVLEVQTASGEIGKASLLLKQVIVRNDEPIFRLEAQCVLLSMTGKLLRLPSGLTSLLAQKPGLSQ
jgi:acyl-CoA thioester hydrolase